MVLGRGLATTGGSTEGLKESIIGIGDFDTFAGLVELDRYGDVEPSAVVLRLEGDDYVPVYQWSPER